MYCSSGPDRIPTVKTDFSVNIEPPVPLRRDEATGSRYLYQLRAKLRDDQIEKIRRCRDAGYSLRQLAREYNVSHETISKAVEIANKMTIRVLGEGGGELSH